MCAALQPPQPRSLLARLVCEFVWNAHVPAALHLAAVATVTRAAHVEKLDVAAIGRTSRYVKICPDHTCCPGGGNFALCTPHMHNFFSALVVGFQKLTPNGL